ncbi:hypothetical protein ML462_15430 [Gramella lutea]|uniref:Leucine-rich repeat domain-containing protein n=1 Tax=Christiangramia lutea TaxID=1607951 RepID=A0A9X1V7Q9_9FLAO|nr:hypothetical protein [Christiangramia lutea]MCH4824564.1 hypothetical protein [Christiangramia lutea]
MVLVFRRILIITILALTNFSCSTDNQTDDQENSSDQEDIIFIPDENFRNTLLNKNCVDTNGDLVPESNVDLNNDEKIQRSEAESVTHLILDFDYGSPKKFVDLQGIENFINIQNLIISGSGGNADNFDQVLNTENLSYDLSNLKKLEYLSIKTLATEHFDNLNLSGLNNLLKLDLSGNRPINYGGDYDNQLMNVDLQGSENLKELNASNSFVILDFCQVPNLEKLNLFYMEGAEPEVFDFHCLTKLKWLNIGENMIESLILKNSSVLDTFITDGVGSSGTNPIYPYPQIICIDNIQQEIDQISPIVGENTTVTFDCSF